MYLCPLPEAGPGRKELNSLSPLRAFIPSQGCLPFLLFLLPHKPSNGLNELHMA